MKCNLFSSKSNALEYIKNFSDDYDAYYSFWRKMKSSDSQKIHFFDIKSIMNDPISFNKFLMELNKDQKIELIGFNYKDNFKNASSFLKDLGLFELEGFY